MPGLGKPVEPMPAKPAVAQKQAVVNKPAPPRTTQQPAKPKPVKRTETIELSDSSDSESETDTRSEASEEIPDSPVQPPVNPRGVAAQKPAPAAPAPVGVAAAPEAFASSRLTRALTFGVGAVFLALLVLSAVISFRATQRGASPGALVESSRAVAADVAGSGALVVAGNALANFSGNAKIVVDTMPLALVLAFLTGGVYGAGTA